MHNIFLQGNVEQHLLQLEISSQANFLDGTNLLITIIGSIRLVSNIYDSHLETLLVVHSSVVHITVGICLFLLFIY